MTPDDHRDKIYSMLLDQHFTTAEFMYILNAVNKELSLKLNLSAKQMVMFDPLSTVLMSSADSISEDEMHAYLRSLIAFALSREVDPIDLLSSTFYMLILIVQTFTTLMDKNFNEIRKQDRSLDRDILSQWIKDHVKILTKEEARELRSQAGACDGDCDNCKNEDHDEDEPCETTKLH